MMGLAVYDTMVARYEDGSPAPYLAESFESSDDFKTWTFTMRDGVMFHDGTPLTAEKSGQGGTAQFATTYVMLSPPATGDLVISGDSTSSTGNSAWSWVALDNVDSIGTIPAAKTQSSGSNVTFTIDYTMAASNGFVVVNAVDNAAALSSTPDYSSGNASTVLQRTYIATGGSGHTMHMGQVPTAGSHSEVFAHFSSRAVMIVVPFETVVDDSDGDGIPDSWEYQWTDPDNLTDLKGDAFGNGIGGAGTGDFDNDGLTDLDEYELSIGTHALYTFLNYPDINPKDPDTDADNLSDFDEVDGFLGDPTLVDTDADGLDDPDEATETTDAFFRDSDGDGARDGFEVDLGTDPTDDADFAKAAGVTVTQITDDASSDIAATKSYTHKISGGGAATVNGVVFDVLTTANSVANFNWTPSGGNTRSAITSANLNGWIPASGGVTGTGIIDLLSTMTYSTNGGDAGESQDYTLSGLTPGNDYTVRLYIRAWSPLQDRPVDITFTNGTEVV
ncbi:MAG: hypothetical protein KDB35_12400, partial [Acidimicrobiales bacterium]|nr:hypothetical protein [Acidimicrobiales bacterium]